MGASHHGAVRPPSAPPLPGSHIPPDRGIQLAPRKPFRGRAFRVQRRARNSRPLGFVIPRASFSLGLSQTLQLEHGCRWPGHKKIVLVFGEAHGPRRTWISLCCQRKSHCPTRTTLCSSHPTCLKMARTTRKRCFGPSSCSAGALLLSRSGTIDCSSIWLAPSMRPLQGAAGSLSRARSGKPGRPRARATPGVTCSARDTMPGSKRDATTHHREPA